MMVVIQPDKAESSYSTGFAPSLFPSKIGGSPLSKVHAFLREVSSLPLSLQAKLLRVLQEGEFEPVGSSKTQKVNVRVVAATNRNLEEEIGKGNFREDLYYRLNVTNWKISGADGAAALLQLPPTTLSSRISKLNIKRVE
jgi:transcriptional regulator with GAF, ATPase, and Fis domain